MPDSSLPIPNQLEQAMSIIRSHVKLLAEAKLQADLGKKRVEEAEAKVRKLENEVNIRDKAIADLRLRLPATMERDLLIKSSMTYTSVAAQNESNTPARAAQATIESLQNRLKQKDETLLKYQDMLKLARDEISNINKQHELEINNMLDQVNMTRDTNLQKLKSELKQSSYHSEINITKNQLSRLQELEELAVEQDNTVSALNQKIKKLNTECDTWKARHDILAQKSEQDTSK
jgi:centrosomal protein CEP290